MNDPVIYSGYEPGLHNLNLESTVNRLDKAGMYRDQSIIVIIPGLEPIPFRIFMALRSLYSPPNQKIVWLGAEGMEVGEAYSTCIENVLKHPDLSNWKYILTVEVDNCPPADGIIKLVEDMHEHPEYACIGGLYFTKGPGGQPQIWGDPQDPVLNFRPQRPDAKGGLVECCGTGMGFNLWRMDIFKDPKLPRPLFKTTASIKEGAQTQDLYFWKNARNLGYRCAVDCSVRVGHWDERGKFGVPKTMW